MTTISYTTTSRLFYACLWFCALPLYVLYFLYRSIRQAEYRKHLSERFAFYSTPIDAPIWLHAASLGEVKAAAPLLTALRTSHPKRAILISCQTPAGRAAAKTLKLENSTIVYLPFDLSFFTQRFIRHFQPCLALIFETEIWPNLFLSSKRSGVPLMIINARITQRSVNRYAKIGTLVAQALKLPEAIICQSVDDARRYIEAGANADIVSVSGNIKWDIELNHDQSITPLSPRNTVWFAASTHEQEEHVVLQIHREILKQWPDALLVWAPRHPERFEFVFRQALQANFNVQRRSIELLPDAHCQLFLLDSLGELLKFLPGANAVFVGGSIQNIGGHNVLEPTSLGLPIIVGPHTQHFADIIEKLIQVDGLIQVQDAIQLQESLFSLLRNPDRANAMGNNALNCVAQNRGALQKTKALIEQRLCV